MRLSRTLAMFATITLIGVACSDDTVGIPAGLEVFTADLNGANERPTAVTTTAKGRAIITVLDNQLTWKVEITQPIDNINAGHIHHESAENAGPVRVNFNPPASGAAFTGTATVGSLVVADSILEFMRAGNSYVNIHTNVNPAGEIRGQLRKL